MFFKKFIAIILASILMLSLVACNTDGNKDDLSDPIDSTQNEQPADSGNDQPADSGDDQPTDSGDDEEPDQDLTYPWAEAPETLKILAIGNSFSVDAMEYLYNIAKSAGVKTIVLGNLRVSGCTIDMHFSYARGNTKTYTYLKNTTGSWISTEGYTFTEGLTDEDWDFITVQQGSPLSGLPEKYNNLEKLVSIIESRKTNPDAKLYWHMTWAYQQDSTHSGFNYYNKSQTEMYKAIVDTVHESVLPLESFVGVIPSGTAVQNARTSFIGDNMTRDGYHMVQPYGRYLVGLMYYAAITGADVSNITYVPAASITADMQNVAKESVKNAMLNMYEVTESAIKEGSTADDNKEDQSDDPADYLQADTKLAAGIGVDLSKYVLLEYEYLTNQYYNSTSRTTPGAASSSQNEKHICFKERYTKEQLMNAVIICDAGWQYRPEAWQNTTDKAATRPGMCSEPIVLLNEEWWGSNVLLALNISAIPQRSLAANYAEAAAHVRIYIPAQ